MAGPISAERADSPDSPDVEKPALPLLALRDGMPPLVDTREALDDVVRAVAAGSGPVALDAERASGYRYSARAYLVQLRREGTGTALIDPMAFDGLADLAAAIGDAEWILQAAAQDLPCLREIGLVPGSLFDTELAARLLGYPRVGLATLVETIIGQTMRKEHSAVDWSKRPLPEPWLEYAALDVEVLIELRARLVAELEESGKAEWAAQEFAHLLDFEPALRVDPWRRTSGIHRVKGRRSLAAVRELWTVRDDLARRQDCSPGRLIPDSAIIAASGPLPTTREALLATPGFHGRAARRYAEQWVGAIRVTNQLPDSELPPLASRADGPPQVRTWAERDPVAAARLGIARAGMGALAEEHGVPVENLLTPDYLRRVLWSPPATEGDIGAAVAAELTRLGARGWQVALTTPVIAEAIATATVKTAVEPPSAADPDLNPDPPPA
ncbi:MAG: HRDC domain-containing protein [Actinomycetota bacterium]|nr:HRDC domain-containing protein [Actinomycetota bacterium]